MKYSPDGLQQRRPASLTDTAYETIVEAIIDQRFKPGAHVTIDKLAAELKMSNTPIREALNRAAAKNLVIQNQNRGFTIAPLLTKGEYDAIFETRRILETSALSNVHPDPDQIDHLHGLSEWMVKMGSGRSYRSFGAFNQADHEFHQTIVTMSRNRFIIDLWKTLNFHLHIARLYVGEGVIDYDEALSEHQQIVNGFKVGDLEAVRRNVNMHILRAHKRLKRLVYSE